MDDTQREEQISAEQQEGWSAWTERALAWLWAEHAEHLPYEDADRNASPRSRGAGPGRG